MDQPLFGEQRRGTQVFQYLVGFIVVGFTAFSLVAGVVLGLKDSKHFALVLCLLFSFVDLAIMVYWYKDKEDRVHPKFRWLVIALVVTVLVCAATLNAYVWAKKLQCPVDPSSKCLGLWDVANKKCYQVSNFPTCLVKDACMFFTGNFGSCAQNCTTARPPKMGYQFLELQ